MSHTRNAQYIYYRSEAAKTITTFFKQIYSYLYLIGRLTLCNFCLSDYGDSINDYDTSLISYVHLMNSRDVVSWRLRAVNSLSDSTLQLFLVSGVDDVICRMWDSRYWVGKPATLHWKQLRVHRERWNYGSSHFLFRKCARDCLSIFFSLQQQKNSSRSSSSIWTNLNSWFTSKISINSAHYQAPHMWRISSDLRM